MSVLVATFRTAFLEAWANRRSFWFQVSIMVANDLAFVAFWILFFGKVGTVRGYDVHQVLLLLAILATVTGLSLGLFANVRKIGQMAADGELDSVLALPVDPLAYVIARRVDTALLGDLAFGPILYLVAGEPTPERTVLFVLGSLCGAAVLMGFLVALGSLTMLFGGRGEHADLGFQATLILSTYPLNVFGGLTKLIMFTALPAAFITGLPTRLVHDFSLGSAFAVAGSALLFAALGRAVFGLGLKYYSSGALWTKA